MRVRCVDEHWVPCEQATCPLRVASVNGMEQILDLDRQQSTELAQIVNGPTGRRCIVTIVAGIDVGPAGAEQRDHSAVAMKSRVMESGRAVGVARARQFRVRRQEAPHALDVTSRYALKKLRDLNQTRKAPYPEAIVATGTTHSHRDTTSQPRSSVASS